CGGRRPRIRKSAIDNRLTPRNPGGRFVVFLDCMSPRTRMTTQAHSLNVKIPPSITLHPWETFVNALRSLAAYILLFAFSQFSAAQSAPDSNPPHTLLGYTPRSTVSERELEKKFQDAVVAANIRENMRRLSARPHNVGSTYDKDNAEWILARFKEWGFD